jgi:3-isopropylmalate dehydrogenase
MRATADEPVEDRSTGVYQIGVIKGAAPSAAEMLDVALGVLAAVGVDVTPLELDIGPERYLRTGELLAPDVLEQARSVDAVLCCSQPVSDHPAIRPGVLERGIVFGLRRELGLAVNLRIFRGLGELANADVAVVRENSEGAYSAEGALLHRGTDGETATEVSITTYAATDRCVRFAFELARTRGGRLTLAHKTRVLIASGALWERAVRTAATDYPDVKLTVENVDTLCARLVADPRGYDVIVTDNVFGDIVSDVACAATHSLAHSASAELSLLSGGPSLFEPMHGPQDAGGTNPLGLLSAVAMMLSDLSEQRLGRALSRATLELASAHDTAADAASLIQRVSAAAIAQASESD